MIDYIASLYFGWYSDTGWGWTEIHFN